MNFSSKILQKSKTFRILPQLVGNRTSVNLSFKVLGSSETNPNVPPVLICHGLLGNKKNWKGIGKTIVNMTERSVVLVDLRNHGASPQTSSHKYEEQAEDLVALIRKLKIEKAMLFGYDMGARAAMCAALTAPKLVAGVLAVEMSPVSTSPDFKEFYPKLIKAMTKVEWKERKKVHKAKKVVKKQLKGLVKNDVTMKTVLSNIIVKKDGTIGWACNLEILKRHFEYISSFPKSYLREKYDGRTLFIGGQMSEYIPADDLSGIRDMFPRAVIKFIPKAGHNVYADNSKAFMELVIAFLRKN